MFLARLKKELEKAAKVEHVRRLGVTAIL